MGASPYAVDRDGRPFVPTGDGGIVLGVRLGDGAFAYDADHVAPGACLVHPDERARFALTAQACIGNGVEVLSGAARGARGYVIGKRGEEGRVIVGLGDDALALLVPGDGVRVEAFGQGARLDAAVAEDVWLGNIDPGLLARLPIDAAAGVVHARVRAVVPSRWLGNGVGRPAATWDVDIQVAADDASAAGLAGLRLGDLVGLRDWDARHNQGHRRGMVTVGVVVHGHSRIPGHGPGAVPILCAPARSLVLEVDGAPEANLSQWLGPTQAS